MQTANAPNKDPFSGGENYTGMSRIKTDGSLGSPTQSLQNASDRDPFADVTETFKESSDTVSIITTHEAITKGASADAITVRSSPALRRASKRGQAGDTRFSGTPIRLQQSFECKP